MNVDKIIMWLSIFIAVFIVMTWYFTNFIVTTNVDISGLTEDQIGIKSIISDLCFVDYYKYNYSLIAENYNLVIDDMKICVSQFNYSNCDVIACDVGTFKFNITSYTGLSFSKNKDNDPQVLIKVVS